MTGRQPTGVASTQPGSRVNLAAFSETVRCTSRAGCSRSRNKLVAPGINLLGQSQHTVKAGTHGAIISVDQYLGLDKRGGTAYSHMKRAYYKKHFQDQASSLENRSRNPLHLELTNAESVDSQDSQEEAEDIKDLKAIGLYPCDRDTIFGGAGSHAYYRSRDYDRSAKVIKMRRLFDRAKTGQKTSNPAPTIQRRKEIVGYS